MSSRDSERLIAFYFQHMMAGCLKADDVQGIIYAGTCHYEPVRAPGHLHLNRAVRRGKPAPCYVNQGRQRIHFTVTDISEYGVLTLNDVQIRRRPWFNPREILVVILTRFVPRIIKIMYKVLKQQMHD